jgi:hypothetical protein
MKAKNLFLLPALALFANATLQGQVTIGGVTEPAPGAILDLNSTAKGGLVLSNVTLTDLSAIPDAISGADAINGDAAKKAQFTGAIFITPERLIFPRAFMSGTAIGGSLPAAIRTFPLYMMRKDINIPPAISATPAGG